MFTTPVTWDTGNTADRAVEMVAGRAAGRVDAGPCKAARYLSAVPPGNPAGMQTDRLGHISACIVSVGPQNLAVEEDTDPEPDPDTDPAHCIADNTGHSQADILAC